MSLDQINMFEHSHSLQISKNDIQQSICSELSGDLKAGMLAIGMYAVVHDCGSESVVQYKAGMGSYIHIYIIYTHNS